MNYIITELQTGEPESEKLIAFPNPARESFTIISESKPGVQIIKKVMVHDILGNLVFEGEMKDNILEIGCSSWVNGVYLINVSNNGYNKTFKLIKDK